MRCRAALPEVFVKVLASDNYYRIKDTTLSLRVPKDLDNRLRNVARTLDLSKNDVARHAIRAALDAIEARGFQIDWPLKMNASPKIPEDLKDELARLSVNDREGIIRTLLRKLREEKKVQYGRMR